MKNIKNNKLAVIEDVTLIYVVNLVHWSIVYWHLTVNFVFMQVLMISHIPPGNPDNLVEYGEIYLNITKQFSDTITGHLFGHTHKDQFQMVITKPLRYVRQP